ncbi:Canalicular multispecific organic anion transporter 1, partial [Homalodisca vitripennis]
MKIDPAITDRRYASLHLQTIWSIVGLFSNASGIFVTHGVTFLSQVDKIIVLKGGEITEEGTFKELMAKKGEFSAFLEQHITPTDDPGLQS